MGVLDISSTSPDWRAHALSNFSPHPLELEGKKFSCAEAFIQGIKFPEEDPDRERTFHMSGREAKAMSRVARNRYGIRAVWWNGKQISYGSKEHHTIIGRAVRAKFQQNQKALKALLATRGMNLTHDFGRPESHNTSFPVRVFIGILLSIRKEYSFR